MKSITVQLGSWLLGTCYLAAQTLSPANIQKVQVVNAGPDVRIEVTLSVPVTPSVEVATNPDRLVLELPNTSSEGKQKHVAAHSPGVRGVRVGLHQADPPVTHLVVDLDASAPYRLVAEGNRVTLIVSPVSASASSHLPPASAVSRGLAGIFRSGGKSLPPSATTNDSPILLTPPPSSPISAPFPGSNQTDNSAHNANSTATASGTTTAPSEIRTAAPGSSFPGASTASPQATATAAPQVATTAAESTPQVAMTVAPAAATIAQAAPTPAPPTAAPAAEPTPQVATTIAPQSPNVMQEAATAPKIEASSSPAPAAAGDSADQTNAPAATEEASLHTTADSLGTDQTLLTLQAADPSLRTVFRVKYVADGVVYLDGGSSSGLGEGMKLVIRDVNLPVQQGMIVDSNDPRIISELQITATAETSSVADIHDPKRPVKVGDLAYLSSGDVQSLIQQRTLSATRKYPAVVAFTEGDTMDEEAHDEVPRPPLPSVNRSRGIFGFDYMGTVSSGSTSMTNSSVGFLTRLDVTRIGGTYWNVRGYWRGRLTSSSVPSQPTLQDMINRTYHLNMTYENPNSSIVAGFGRLYLPYAPSLDTIDGGYFGLRFAHGGTVGIFGGSTPDPTSWSYNPDGKIAGAFVNFEGGSYDDLHYTSTSGLGVNALKWQITRPFVFFENAFSYKRWFSIYDSLQADSPSGNQVVAAPGPGLSRNFLTVRIQPFRRLELDVNHTYFRDIPTFDPQLIGTGLLDKYLFQGFSAGGRLEVVKQIWVYTNLGQSSRSGDAKSSLNEAFGLTVNRIPRLGLHADVHYSRFNSSFGTGNYRALSISRNLSEAFNLQVLLGDESFTSSLTTNNRSRFINGTVETILGGHYFLQGGFTADRGSMNYNQWMFTLGYRFDSRAHRQ